MTLKVFVYTVHVTIVIGWGWGGGGVKPVKKVSRNSNKETNTPLSRGTHFVNEKNFIP